jgi:uncharacterized FAD-dependent dehydrogenase
MVFMQAVGHSFVARDAFPHTYIKDGREHSLETRALILAIGHSARDTYEMLAAAGSSLLPSRSPLA